MDREMGKIVTAKYNGECPLCELPITAGVDRIVFDEWEGTWVHVNCLRDEAMRGEPDKALAEGTP